MAKKDLENKKSILFVCTANLCRSPMAMALFRDLVSRQNAQPVNWRIESAGILAVEGYSATDFAIRTMKDLGLDLSDHLSQPATESLLDEFNLILCMESEHVSFLQCNFPGIKDKVFLLSEMAGKVEDVWDPVRQPLAAYKETAEKILAFLEGGFSKITKLSKQEVYRTIVL